MLRLIERCLEKYVKILIGIWRTEIHDDLKTLDKLTRGESWMAIIQNLTATLAVSESVRRVEDTVVAISNSVADVYDRVAGLGGRVVSVDGRVRMVDDRVVEVIHGA